MTTLAQMRSEVARDHGWHEDDDGDRIDEVLNERFGQAAVELYAALERAQAAVLSLGMWELGGAVVERTDGSGIDYQYPIRDELVSEIETALSKARAQ